MIERRWESFPYRSASASVRRSYAKCARHMWRSVFYDSMLRHPTNTFLSGLSVYASVAVAKRTWPVVKYMLCVVSLYEETTATGWICRTLPFLFVPNKFPRCVPLQKAGQWGQVTNRKYSSNFWWSPWSSDIWCDRLEMKMWCVLYARLPNTWRNSISNYIRSVHLKGQRAVWRIITALFDRQCTLFTRIESDSIVWKQTKKKYSPTP